MDYPVKTVHLELTDKCQAQCPMCPRNWYGGKERSYVRNTEISLQQFKQWFPPEFIGGLHHIYACGNLGDPLLATDCLEIFEYIEKHLPQGSSMAIMTNASLRNKEWWIKLAKVFKNRGYVVFAIDGLEDTHSIYRRNTSFDKVIENLKTFISAGGTARVDSIVFKHNEHQVNELEKYLLDLGVSEVNFKATQRFYGGDRHPVKNKNDELEYYISSPIGDRWTSRMLSMDLNELVKPNVYKSLIDNSVIEPDCLKTKGIFVNAAGQVFPCCMINMNYTNHEFDGIGAEYEIRDRLMNSAIEFTENAKILTLNETNNISDLIKDCGWYDGIIRNTTSDKKLICVKSCASNLRSIIENKENSIPVKFG